MNTIFIFILLYFLAWLTIMVLFILIVFIISIPLMVSVLAESYDEYEKEYYEKNGNLPDTYLNRNRSNLNKNKKYD